MNDSGCEQQAIESLMHSSKHKGSRAQRTVSCTWIRPEADSIWMEPEAMMLVSVMSPETVVMSSWPMKAALLCSQYH